MITIDDQYRLEDFGLRATMGYTDPTTVGFMEKVQPIPGKPGVHLFGEDVDVRLFSVPFKLANESHEDIDQKLNKLADLFYDHDGKRVAKKITLDHWGGKYVMGYLDTQISSDRRLYHANLTLDFVCYDPYKYSPVLADEVTWGSEVITFNSGYLLGHEGADGLVTVTGNTSLNVYVDGLNVYPEIEISGSANNLRLMANGQTIQLPNFTNSNWVIERFNAWQNSQERFVDARKFKLNHGSNQIQVTGSNVNIQIRIKVRDTYK